MRAADGGGLSCLARDDTPVCWVRRPELSRVATISNGDPRCARSGWRRPERPELSGSMTSPGVRVMGLMSGVSIAGDFRSPHSAEARSGCQSGLTTGRPHPRRGRRRREAPAGRARGPAAAGGGGRSGLGGRQAGGRLGAGAGRRGAARGGAAVRASRSRRRATPRAFGEAPPALQPRRVARSGKLRGAGSRLLRASAAAVAGKPLHPVSRPWHRPWAARRKSLTSDVSAGPRPRAEGVTG
jgi:hypothetical protein